MNQPKESRFVIWPSTSYILEESVLFEANRLLPFTLALELSSTILFRTNPYQHNAPYFLNPPQSTETAFRHRQESIAIYLRSYSTRLSRQIILIRTEMLWSLQNLQIPSSSRYNLPKAFVSLSLRSILWWVCSLFFFVYNCCLIAELSISTGSYRESDICL